MPACSVRRVVTGFTRIKARRQPLVGKRRNVTDDVQARILSFLNGYIHMDGIGNDADIFQLGFVNSLFAMELVLYVEREFGITVEDEDLELENFSTVNALARLVESKTGHAPGT